MKTIYKYRLPPFATTVLSMPKGARILDIGDQFGDLCVWALIDSSQPYVGREFKVIGTGHPIGDRDLDGFSYYGTVQQNGGVLVWHVFARNE